MSLNLQILILRYSQKQIISLLPVVFETDQLPVSLKPIDQFQCAKCFANDEYNQSEKLNLTNSRLILLDHVTYM